MATKTPALRLSTTQQRLLESARRLSEVNGHGLLVSGHAYRTAESLQRKGLGSLRYQGHSPYLGWFVAPVPQDA